jgi:ribosomal protein S11
MKLNLIKAGTFLFVTLAILASCQKEEDIPQEYLRGGNSLLLNDNGDLVIAGYNSVTSKSYDASLMLVKSNGDSVSWRKEFGGTYSDAFYNVKKSHEGGYIACGFSNAASASSPNMYVVITDAAGTQIKATKYGSPAYSQGFCVLPHTNADSGYIVSGYRQEVSRYDKDIYLVRLNNAGDKLWEKTIGSRSSLTSDTVNDVAYQIIAAADSGYYITGSLHGYSSCCGKIFLMKVSPTGDSLWTKTYAAGIGFSLTLTSDGGIAIGGTIQETSNQDIIILKTDTAGNLIWSKTYGDEGYEYGAMLVETSDAGLAITGITNTSGTGYDDIYLVRTNSTGDQLWAKTYGGDKTDQGFGLVKNSDNGFSITGLSNSGGSYFFLNKTDAEGNEQWQKKIQ